MDEQDQTEDGAHIEGGTNDGNVVTPEAVAADQSAQPESLSISSFPFAPEFMKPEKARAIKILEEASEACEAFKTYLKGSPYSLEDKLSAQEVFLDEFCDTFQALFTAAACVGVQQEELDSAMEACFQKNIDKGRYSDREFEVPETSEESQSDDPIFPPEPPAGAATYNKPSIEDVMAHAMERWED